MKNLKLRRPILVGGLGLTASLWLVNSLGSSVMEAGGEMIWGAIALGAGWMWWQRRLGSSASDPVLNPVAPIESQELEREFAAVDVLLTQLSTEFTPISGASTTLDTLAAGFQSQLTDLRESLKRSDLHIGILGNPAVGKTTILNHLSTQWRSPLLDKLTQSQPPASIQAVTLHEFSEAEISQDGDRSLTDTDLLLFVTTGDLTESEFQQLKQLVSQRQRVMLVFNKQDQYPPDERPEILAQLQQRVQSFLLPEDVVAVSACPAAIKVRQHKTDGSMQETLEYPDPSIASLSDRLTPMILQSSADLVRLTTFRQTQQLKHQVLEQINQLRRDRALPMIEQAQWIAAAAAFANPFPSLDLLATAAVNTQLVMDLGAIYHQKISLDQAQEITRTMAAVMVKLGIVELTSQAIAPLLKLEPMTYVASGLMQGTSAAYLTRIAGLSLVDYFQAQSYRPTANSDWKEALTQRLQGVFQAHQRTELWKSLVQQALQRLTPKSVASAQS